MCHHVARVKLKKDSFHVLPWVTVLKYMPDLKVKLTWGIIRSEEVEV